MFGRIYDYLLMLYRSFGLANELQSLSDRELADIGLIRGQIVDLVREHAEGVAQEQLHRQARRAFRVIGQGNGRDAAAF